MAVRAGDARWIGVDYEAVHDAREPSRALSTPSAFATSLGRWLLRRVGPAALALLLVGALACDGASSGDDTADAAGVEPDAAGTPLPTCIDDGDCATGSSCAGAAAGVGHCFVDGTGGGRCRAGAAVGGACDPGLACAGKNDTCVPLVANAADCTASACAPDQTCGLTESGVLRCARPGQEGGACRAATGSVCNTGLACVETGDRCAPVRADNVCFEGGQQWGCADGLVCPAGPATGASFTTTCVRPGAFGQPCRAVGTPEGRCDTQLGCFNASCQSFVLAPGDVCLSDPDHARCEDGSSCQANACVLDGMNGGQCRAMSVGAHACDAGLACDSTDFCRPALADGAACDPALATTGGPICAAGSSCLSSGRGFVCARDGRPGGVCRLVTPLCDAPLVCAAGMDADGPRCVVALADGAACTPARERFEPCQTSSACSIASETCAARGTLGSLCTGRGTCASGLTCAPDASSQHCYPTPLFVAGGAACDTNPRVYLRTNACMPGFACVGGACTPDGAKGAPCRALGDPAGLCDAGLACGTGACVPGVGVGSSCLAGGIDECAAPLVCVGTSAATCTALGAYTWAEEPSPSDLDVAFDACDGGQTLAFSALVSSDDPRDDGVATVPLGFSFPFFGQRYDSVDVRPDGVMGFPPPSDVFSPGPGGAGALPQAGTPALIAPFWDDLVLGDPARSNVCTRAAADTLLVEWRNVSRFGRASTNLTFAVALHADGRVDFAWNALTAVGDDDDAFVTGVRAAMGVQSPGGLRSLVHSGRVATSSMLHLVPPPS